MNLVEYFRFFATWYEYLIIGLPRNFLKFLFLILDELDFAGMIRSLLIFFSCLLLVQNRLFHMNFRYKAYIFSYDL